MNFLNESYTIRTDKLKMAVYSLCNFQKKLKKENENYILTPSHCLSTYTSSHEKIPLTVW